MIPYMRMTVYRLVQFTIAVIAIQLNFVGFHGNCPSVFHILLTEVWETPTGVGGEKLPRKTRQLYHI